MCSSTIRPTWGAPFCNAFFCPSCSGRRMAETAAHLVDAVIPDVPVRQWVLSLPYDIRFALAYEPELLSGVRRIFLRALLAWMASHAERHGIASGQSGAVCFVQRFDSSLKLNPHMHVLVLDGVYTVTDDGFPLFHDTPPPSNDDVARLNEVVAHRVRRS